MSRGVGVGRVNRAAVKWGRGQTRRHPSLERVSTRAPSLMTVQPALIALSCRRRCRFDRKGIKFKKLSSPTPIWSTDIFYVLLGSQHKYWLFGIFSALDSGAIEPMPTTFLGGKKKKTHTSAHSLEKKKHDSFKKTTYLSHLIFIFVT